MVVRCYLLVVGCRFVGVGLWEGFPLVNFVGYWCSCSCSSCFVVVTCEGGRQRGQGKDEDGEEDTLGHLEGVS